MRNRLNRRAATCCACLLLMGGLIGCAQSIRPASAMADQPGPTVPAQAAAAPPLAAAEPAASTVETRNPFEYGQTEAVKPDANPGAVSVAEALTSKAHPERLSPLIAPKAFDLAAYEKAPAAYLDVVEPGRVFQVAQPGPGVLRVQAVGSTLATIEQGASVPLRVHAPAGMPVTFTSFDLGRFAENQLTSITVAANEHSVAQATFVGAAGTIGQVNILAACPVTAGQITFHVEIIKN